MAFSYTRSQSVMNPTIAAKVDEPEEHHSAWSHHRERVTAPTAPAKTTTPAIDVAQYAARRRGQN